jgi:hypothetical protein
MNFNSDNLSFFSFIGIGINFVGPWDCAAWGGPNTRPPPPLPPAMPNNVGVGGVRRFVMLCYDFLHKMLHSAVSFLLTVTAKIYISNRM